MSKAVFHCFLWREENPVRNVKPENLPPEECQGTQAGKIQLNLNWIYLIYSNIPNAKFNILMYFGIFSMPRYIWLITPYMTIVVNGKIP